MTSFYRQSLRRLPVAILCLAGLLSLEAFPQNRRAESRPLNSFNLRNLRIHFIIPAARPLAMGGTAIALPNDPTSATVNPAGLILFARPAISSSTQFTIRSTREPSFSCTDIPGKERYIDDGDFFWDQTLFSAIFRLGRLHFSTFRETVYDSRISAITQQPLQVGANNETAAILQANFPSRNTAQKTQIIDNGLSLAFGLGGKLSFGASLRITRFEYTLLERQYFAAAFPDNAPGCYENALNRDNLYLIQDVDEKQWGLGFSLGLLKPLGERLTVGLTANFRPSFDLEVRTTFPDFAVDRGNRVDEFESRRPDSLFSLAYDIPDAYGLGIACKPARSVNLNLDLIYILYREFLPERAELRNLIQDDGPAGGGDPDGEPDLTLSNQLEFRIGLEYMFRPDGRRARFPLRLGYYYDPAHIIHAPSREDYIRENFPKGTGDHHHITAGAGIFSGERLRFDGAVDLSRRSLVIIGSSVYTF